MAKYKCPVKTCNIHFDGSIWEISPQAQMHAQGSHKLNVSQEEVFGIIEKQAIGQEAPDPTLQREKNEEIQTGTEYDWWKK